MSPQNAPSRSKRESAKSSRTSPKGGNLQTKGVRTEEQVAESQAHPLNRNPGILAGIGSQFPDQMLAPQKQYPPTLEDLSQVQGGPHKGGQRGYSTANNMPPSMKRFLAEGQKERYALLSEPHAISNLDSRPQVDSKQPKTK